MQRDDAAHITFTFGEAMATEMVRRCEIGL